MKELSKEQIENISLLIYNLNMYDMLSFDMKLGILCVIGKESHFKISWEKSYRNTPNDRIRNIFGVRKLGKYYFSDEALNKLKSNDILFFSWVYRNVAGNGDYETQDGYKYRGWGFIQHTGLENHRLITNYNSNDAAYHAVKYFIKKIKTKKFLSKYGKCKNDVQAVCWMNAGMGKNPNSKVVIRAYNNALKYEEICRTHLILNSTK